MGRPRVELDWEAVEKLCELQCTQEEIAWFAGCSVDTLDRACRREFEMSFAEFFRQKRGRGRITLRRAQWQAATGGSVPMLIWLGKQYLSQAEKAETSTGGKTFQLAYKLQAKGDEGKNQG